MPKVYALGAVKPHVKDAANTIGNMFGINVIYGVGSREGASDHPIGLALDFMTRNGDGLATYARANATRFGIKYVIWKQHIWSVNRDSEGWRPMENRGNDTANHFDHVHVSFYSQGGRGKGGVINTGDEIPVAPGEIGKRYSDDPDLPGGLGSGIGESLAEIRESIKAVGAIGSWIADTHNWYRMGLFILGGLLILLAVGKLIVDSTGITAKSVTKVAKGVVK